MKCLSGGFGVVRAKRQSIEIYCTNLVHSFVDSSIILGI
jgi:hypothetical protein